MDEHISPPTLACSFRHASVKITSTRHLVSPFEPFRKCCKTAVTQARRAQKIGLRVHAQQSGWHDDGNRLSVLSMLRLFGFF